MALTDTHQPSSGGVLRAPNPGALSATSVAALARLSQIHAETSEAAKLSRFLRAALPAAAVLMALGALAVGFASGASLKHEFAWALLVLAGVGAMLRSYIKSTAQAFDRAPLREAAKDLRAVMLYTGFAWGAGAFLVLGDNPLPIMGLCFAVMPSVLLLPLLRDKAAILAFIAPVTLLTAAAVVLEGWGGMAVALAILLVVQGSIVAGLALGGHARQSMPAGLSLR
jgi:hypothetical protein